MAKTNQAHMMLASQFQERTVEKEYIALCYGQFAQNVQAGQEWEGLAQDYIGRSHIERKKMMCMGPIYSKNHEENIQLGKHSSMQYKIQDCKYIDEKTGFISRIQCLPQTGRMHQIRLQLAQRKLPIIGDALYGKKQNQAICNILGNRIGLHSSSICFTHPITKKNMKITSPMPESFDIIMKNN
jgi:23S rRNA pseudouridine1911/1915/1917 synthase